MSAAGRFIKYLLNFSQNKKNNKQFSYVLTNGTTKVGSMHVFL